MTRSSGIGARDNGRQYVPLAHRHSRVSVSIGDDDPAGTRMAAQAARNRNHREPGLGSERSVVPRGSLC